MERCDSIRAVKLLEDLHGLHDRSVSSQVQWIEGRYGKLNPSFYLAGNSPHHSILLLMLAIQKKKDSEERGPKTINW